METLQITSKEFADKQNIFFGLATRGTQIQILWENNQLFALMPIQHVSMASNENDSYVFSPEEIARIEHSRQQARAGKVVRCRTAEESGKLLESL
ncbi:MAG: hypothetical protein LBS63_00240 [Prevotellaceae bacterium]|jgi:hypothetical protein|nr:hypothetical protein [Prevotellaceae bacterium]